MPYRLFPVKADIEKRQQQKKGHERPFPAAGICCRGKRRRHGHIDEACFAKANAAERDFLPMAYT